MASKHKPLQVHFRVAYWTQWGQHVYLCGALPSLGSWDISKAKQMSCHHDGDPDGTLIWETCVTVPAVGRCEYRYAVVNEDGTVEKWERATRTLTLEDDLCYDGQAEVLDSWQDRGNPYVVLSTGAFRKAIGLYKTRVTNPSIPRQISQRNHTVVRFMIRDCVCEDGQKLYVTGGIPQLGNWQQDSFFALTEVCTPTWEGEILVPTEAFPFTYKYSIVDSDGPLLESGESRLIALPESEDTCLIVKDDGHFRHRMLWRGGGVAVPVFSLRSEDSVGVGEFEDLKLLVDLCVGIGFQLIQVLPVNDTSVHMMWWDSYPYSSLSVFALHPLYLRLDMLSDDMSEDIHDEIMQAQRTLDLAKVDYTATLDAKLKIGRKIFDEEGGEVMESSAFLDFFENNKDWLKPYAAFCFLRDLFETSDHTKWGEMSEPTTQVLDRITSPDRDYHQSIQFTYYIQYHLHCQLLGVREYAEQKGVVLKGDLPIGVNKSSVDTWLRPSNFRMDKSTGAPPDFFNPHGQNWGFPTYNWEEMSKDKYLWWRQRLHKMSEYFHAYRIDHILGFFRIWEIPGECLHALLGCYRPTYPITKQELEERGIWDFDRLCEPYVRRHILEEMFGEMAAEVSWKYFDVCGDGFYKFREEFNSEAKINGILARKPSQWLIDEVESIKTGLLTLFQNVVLTRHPEQKNAFAPRFNLMHTSSFRELNPQWRADLNHLHDDYYYHRQNDLWRSHSLKTLPVLIDASDMLVCGEDLGTIPSCVHPIMDELGVLSLRIQRMPSEEGREFGDTSAYPYLTVCSPSCHDVLTTRAWWEDDLAKRERFYYETLGGKGEVPQKCKPDIMKQILQQHICSPSMLMIAPLQDLFALSDKYNTVDALEEVINDPRNPHHYWRYRMHMTLETLLQDAEFQSDILKMMKDGCRGAKEWKGGKHCWKGSNGYRAASRSFSKIGNRM